MNIKNFVQAAVVCFVVTAGIAGCSKDDAPAILSDQKAIFQEKTLVPSSDTIFFNLQGNAQVDKPEADVSFAGLLSLDLAAVDADGYRLGYFDSQQEDLSDITVSVLDTASIQYAAKITYSMINSTFAGPTANAWWNYDFSTHTVAPVEGRYVIFFEGDENTPYSSSLDKVYVLKLTNITQSGTTASDVSFQSKLFTK